MSTKNLRKLVDHYRRITGAGFVPREVQLIDAIGELEAIERAAKELCSPRGGPHLKVYGKAWDLLESIAKDAP
jgi:hypothetical protein